MNKLIKGSVAGAAGVALLMGSFGTYAVWNDEAGMAGGSIQSGTLEVTSTGTAVWQDVSTATAKAIELDTFQVVPGDKLQMTQQFTLTAAGDNIAGAVSLVPGTLTDSADGKLADELTYEVTVTDGAEGFTFTKADSQVANAPTTYSFTGAGTELITANVVVDFSNLTPNADASKNATAELSGMQIQVTQDR
jgi:alternate signal-mediated exported protein